MLSKFKKAVITDVRKESSDQNELSNNEGSTRRGFDPNGCVFTDNGKMWDVPIGYQFPRRVTLREG